jgi:hypothetical protein
VDGNEVIKPGPNAGKDTFSYGFRVHVAWEPSCSDKNTPDIEQEICMIIEQLDNKAVWTYVVSDGNHNREILDADEGDPILKSWFDDKQTYLDETEDLKKLLWPEKQVLPVTMYDHGNNWAEWFDAPGYNESNGAKEDNLDATKFVKVVYRLAVRITATGKGATGNTITAGFWTEIRGVPKDGKWILDPDRKENGPHPPLPKTWEPKVDK